MGERPVDPQRIAVTPATEAGLLAEAVTGESDQQYQQRALIAHIVQQIDDVYPTQAQRDELRRVLFPEDETMKNTHVHSLNAGASLE